MIEPAPSSRADASALARPSLRPSQRPWERQACSPALPLRTRLSIALARAVRWEFWPAWLFYLPIVAWIGILGVRHRSFLAFTAANPGIATGGVVGERKHTTLGPLQRNAPDLIAPFERLLDASRPGRAERVLQFVARHGFPVVLKPNVGQRGRGVYVARDRHDVERYLDRFDGDVLVQRYARGAEFGIFIARPPGAPLRILSIVHKAFEHVTGDGRRTLRTLILAQPRARLIAPLLLRRWHSRLEDVPAAGEVVPLVEVGAHCRGSTFLDARELATPELVVAVTRIVAAVPGYAFGRIDLRAPSPAHLQRGEGLQVLELNGVTAESAHIYHPGASLFAGYRAMFEQWHIAFEIGAANVALGARPSGAIELLRCWRADRRLDREWF